MTEADCRDLERRLAEAKEFGKLQDYFFTTFIEHGDLMSLGNRLEGPRSDMLIETAVAACQHVFGPGKLAVESILVEVPEFGLIHGTISLNGKMGAMLYFERTRQGLFTLVENVSTGKTHHMRFSTARAQAASAYQSN